MLFIPHIPPSGIGPPRYWRRVLVMLFAGILAVGGLQPANAHTGPHKLWVRDASVVEGDTGTTTAQVKIFLKRKHHFRKVSVAFRTVDGTAVAGSDYVAQRGRVWFPKRTRVAYVEVPVIGDTADEADEYFKVRLFRPFRARIVDRVGIVTILDDDPAPAPVLPKLSISDDSTEEGTAAWFKISLSKPAAGTVTFDYATADGTAEAGKDYDAASGNDKAIAAGETHIWIQVMTREDDLDEPHEYFYLDVSDVKGATVLDGQGKGTILDDDVPQPSLTIQDVEVVEGKQALLEVTLSAASDKTVAVDWTTYDGSAVKVDDYAATSGTLYFQAGQTVRPITVDTIDDSTAEATERLLILLTNPVNALLADDLGKVTILDNDTP